MIALSPGIVATVQNEVPSEKLRDADWCEIRADCWPGGPDNALSFISKSPVPVLFTCRIPAEGGFFTGTETQRTLVYEQALSAGAALVDIEGESDLFRHLHRIGADWPILASKHDFSGSISDIPARIAEFSRRGACAVKMISTVSDISGLFEVKKQLNGSHPVPLVSFGMGDSGIASRFLALCWGSLFTYTACGAPAAPGQVDLKNFIGTCRHLCNESFHVAVCAPGHEQAVAWSDKADKAARNSKSACAFVPFPVKDTDSRFLTTACAELGLKGVMRVKEKQPCSGEKGAQLCCLRIAETSGGRYLETTGQEAPAADFSGSALDEAVCFFSR